MAKKADPTTSAASATAAKSAQASAAPVSATQVQWIEKCAASFIAGEAFMFAPTGDTDGYALRGMRQRDYLVAMLERQDYAIAFYDRARGFSFPEDKPTMKHRERLTTLLREADTRASQAALASGKTAPKPQQANPMAAVLGALGQPGAGNAGEDDPFAVTSPRAAFALMERLLRCAPESVAIVVSRADLLLPNADKAMMSADDRTLLDLTLAMAADDALANMGNPMFLFCRQRTELHADLRAASSGIKLVEIALPDRAARQAYIEWYLAERRANSQAIALVDVSVDELANATAGLSLRHVENVLLLGAQTGVTRRLVKEAKDDIIASEQAEVAEMMDPLPGGFADMGGADHLVNWAKAELIAPIREGRWQDVPKGVVLVGPPGTGKTRMAQALAKETGFNAVAMRADKILNGIVGESEKRMAQFLSFVKALAPVLVFVDELDESDFGKRGANSGNPVAGNLFNQMLTFMGDEANRGRVIMVFATNRPDRLDSALLRFGRMDAVIPVLLPNAANRAKVVEVQARLQNVALAEGVAATVAERSDRYSPADLAAVVTKARKLAARETRNEISEQDALRALAFLRPNTPRIADEYTRLALEACNDIELLPQELMAEVDTAQATAAEDFSLGGGADADEDDGVVARGRRGRRGWA